MALVKPRALLPPGPQPPVPGNGSAAWRAGHQAAEVAPDRAQAVCYAYAHGYAEPEPSG